MELQEDKVVQDLFEPGILLVDPKLTEFEATSKTW